MKEKGFAHLLESVENQESETVDEASGIPLASPFFIPQPFVKGLHSFCNLSITYAVRAGKKLVHERLFARVPSFARAFALTYLELHVRSKICLSVIQSVLLLKNANCLV